MAENPSPPDEAGEHVDALTELAGLVLRQTDLRSTLGEICRIATRAVPKVAAASITTLEQGRPAALASDDWGQLLDELQYVEHEGPCLDAYRTGNAFRVEDFGQDPRWPAYSRRAFEHGAVSMLSIPMSAEGKLIGALNLYSRDRVAFDPQSVALAEIIAGHAGLASQVAAAFFGHRDLAEHLAEAMQSRATIEQAKGVIMARERCDAEAAFQTLVAVSSRTHRKLRDLAMDLVAEASMPAG
jgi:GAF domain-containing protein